MSTAEPAAAQSRLRARPTARGAALGVLTLVCWIGGDLVSLAPARALAAAGVLALLAGLVCIVCCAVRLQGRRELVDDAVTAGQSARVQVTIDPRALFLHLPLGRGILREQLPAALGGAHDLPLSGRMPHAVPIPRRGAHALGPYALIVRDLLGLFQVARRTEDGAVVMGLPPVEEVGLVGARAAGISREGADALEAAPGLGEIGPIARPYITGDDIRRVHWRASARTGRLMTREDEPASGLSAVIVLDTRRPAGSRTPERIDVEDRLISHAASLLEALGENGWEARVVDASGEEITRTDRRRGALGDSRGSSAVGREADALAARSSRLALAELDVDETDEDGDAGAAPMGQDHAAGHTALAIALGCEGPGAEEPFAGLSLDRFAGRARHRTAIALRPEGTDDDGVSTLRLGAWTLVRGRTGHRLAELLEHSEPALAHSSPDGGGRS